MAAARSAIGAIRASRRRSTAAAKSSTAIDPSGRGLHPRCDSLFASMKIPRSGDHADVARVAMEAVVDARVRRIGVVVGNAIELRRTVEDFLRHQMNHVFGTALNLSFNEQQPSAHHGAAEFFYQL